MAALAPDSSMTPQSAGRCELSPWSAFSTFLWKLLLGHRLCRKAAALVLPFVFVVLGVVHDLEHIDLVAAVENPRYQPVLPARDIEHGTVSDAACRPKFPFDISPRSPRDRSLADMAIP